MSIIQFLNSVKRVLRDEVKWIKPNPSHQKFDMELYFHSKGDVLTKRNPIND
jgi:hypothetical protein